MLPIHASLGLAVFFLAVATALTGLTQVSQSPNKPNCPADDSIPEHNNSDDRTDTKLDKISEPEFLLLEIIGVILAVLAILITVAVRRTNSPSSFRVYVTDRIWGNANKVGMVREVTEITVTDEGGADAQPDDVEKY